MRILMITAAVLALAACNRGTANNSSANKATPATANAAAPAAPAPAAPAPAVASAGGLPEGFPKDDPKERGFDCGAYLTSARVAGATPGGHDTPAMQQAAAQWVATLQQGGITEAEYMERVEPAVAALANTPVATRDAAAAWCVENAPGADAEG